MSLSKILIKAKIYIKNFLILKYDWDTFSKMCLIHKFDDLIF